MRYAGEAPLSALSSAYKGRASGAISHPRPASTLLKDAPLRAAPQGSSTPGCVAASPVTPRLLPPSPDALEFLNGISDDEGWAEARAACPTIALPQSVPGATFVINCKTDVAHHAGGWLPTDPMHEWRTPCGWPYGFTASHRTNDINSMMKCKTCMRRRPDALWCTVASDSEGSFAEPL